MCCPPLVVLDEESAQVLRRKAWPSRLYSIYRGTICQALISIEISSRWYKYKAATRHLPENALLVDYGIHRKSHTQGSQVPSTLRTEFGLRPIRTYAGSAGLEKA